ncbi:sigma-E processing peptidase SpoIIGA [Cohnella lubricantis]|uniref:Sigma-E processing peptidase SpoIIGA n=1 Tax=Cohnella lubricantis TaxID=2163172 RepID=A0A841TDJ6_9BACL|nr:sigma-E processing peptidase SpoIIGA [Cohnella lubricantis]MBB6677310.1 sigma-E processing peptidase SpoIIGA [Cohnella lubricantis]MBP2116878.1 stage II sporulation protein GA (sporulation sigma-E factor processing peptidase) [Cohnella lubricantis]
MIVYVDMVFLTNLAVDGTVLLTTAKVRRLQPKRRRIALSAGMGAVYAAGMFMADVPYLYSFAVKVLVSLAMLLCAFGYGSPLRLARLMGTFYLVSFATLGGVLGLTFLLRQSRAPWSDLSLSPDGGLLLELPLQFLLLAVCFALSVWLFRGASASAERTGQLDSLIVNVAVTIGGETRECRGLVDTGNRLYDPLTRIPVMMMEASLWKEQLPSGWAERLKDEPADSLVAGLDHDSSEGYAWGDRLRLIPYRGVNGNTRLLLAIKPDSVSISPSGAPSRHYKRVLIGMDGGTLSPDGSYRAIVHPDLGMSFDAEAAPSQTA